MQPYAAGIPGELRVIFFPRPQRGHTVRQLEPDVGYSAFFLSPISGEELAVGAVEPTEEGEWVAPVSPVLHDWVLVLEAEHPRGDP